MDASRLLALINELEADFTSGYDERLTTLTTAFTQQRDNPGQDLSPQIQQARTALEEWLSESRVNSLVPSRRQMMDAVGASSLFGQGALARLTEILNTPGAGPATMVARLEEFRTELAKIRTAMTDVQKGLDGLRVAPDELRGDEYEVGVLLPMNVLDGGRLGALDKQVRRMNELFKDLQELAGEPEREVRLRGTANGSILLFLIVGVATAQMVAKLADTIASTIERVLRIKVLLKNMGDLNIPLVAIEEVQKEKDGLVEREVKDLVEALVSSSKARVDPKHLKEIETHLQVTIRHSMKLVDEGGAIEVSVPHIESEDYSPPKADGGEPLPDEQVSAHKEEWEKLRAERVEEHARIQERGAALGRLPARPKPVLNLPEPDEPDSGGEENSDEPKPKPKKK